MLLLLNGMLIMHLKKMHFLQSMTVIVANIPLYVLWWCAFILSIFQRHN